MRLAILIIAGVLWGLLTLASALFTLLIFAFSDSPDMNRAAGKLLWPVMIVAILSWSGGALLIGRGGSWWQILIALALVPLPPTLLILGLKSA